MMHYVQAKLMIRQDTGLIRLGAIVSKESCSLLSFTLILFLVPVESNQAHELQKMK